MTLLLVGDLVTKNAMSMVFSWENPDSGMRVSEGETGWKEMRDVREMDVEDGD